MHLLYIFVSFTSPSFISANIAVLKLVVRDVIGHMVLIHHTSCEYAQGNSSLTFHVDIQLSGISFDKFSED